MTTAAAARKSAAKTAPSSAPVRRDPRRLRHVDAVSPWANLINKRDDRKYVLANKADEMHGVSYYEALGYQVEHAGDPVKHPSCLRFAAGKTCRPGETLENFGHVVMSIELERWQEIEREGIFGGGGQAHADKVERLITRRSGGRALMRGLGVEQFTSIKNETEAIEIETPDHGEHDPAEDDAPADPNADPFSS